jgi:CheY-like chemotaxis protein
VTSEITHGGDTHGGAGRAPRPILIVDDDELIRDELRDTLEARGYEVLEASNGREALTLLTGDTAPEPSLILLDLKMPVMTGWEFLAIVQNYRRLARLPVLVVTGTRTDDEALAHAAITDHLSKPIVVDDLLSKVTQLTERTPSSS